MDSSLVYVIPVVQQPKVVSLVPADPGSRYKTKQLQVQVVGKSKMIKTVLVNILEVAKSMQVPPPYIGTFMGYEIGAQAKWDAKKPERQQAFISGEHQTIDLSRILEKFICEVILCPVCGLPELLINKEGKNKVTGSCRACGGNSELPITNDKFRRYIINHLPSAASGEKGAFAGNKVTSKPVKKQEPVKTKTKVVKKKVKEEDEDNDNVVWYSDTSAEAAEKRREEMVPKALEEMDERIRIAEFITVITDSQIPHVFDKLKKLKAKQDLKEEKFLTRLFSAMFDTSTDLRADISKHLGLLKNYVKPKTQNVLLSYLGLLCESNATVAPKIALVLKDLYDEDLLEEDEIINYFESEEATPTFKEKASPFINWLQEADEDDEEEDDEEEDDEEDDEEDN